MANNYLYFVGGISCAGKSTRVLALKCFLDALPEVTCVPFNYTNAYGQTKQIGYLYNNKLLIIGKFIERNGKTAWQGLDSFTNFLQEDLGQQNLYNKLFEWVKQYSVIVEASLMVRSPYSRPNIIRQYVAEPHVRTWMFCAKDVEEYSKRLALRSTRKVTKDSGMWKSNNSFANHVKHFAEELLPNEDMIATLEAIDAPVTLVGEGVIMRTPELNTSVFKFLEFCSNNLEELHHIGAL